MATLTRFFFTGEFQRYEDLFRSYPHTRETFDKGSYLCRPSEPLIKCYFITDGMTQMSVMHPSGKEMIFGFWGRGGIYPLVVSEQEFDLEYSIVLKTLTFVDTLAFDVPVMKAILEEHPDIAAEAIDHYARFTNSLIFSSLASTYDSVMERLLSFLDSCLIYLPTVDNSISLSQEDIASVIGTSRVSVAREITELRNLGILKTARNRIYITDVRKLREMESALYRSSGH